MSRVTTLDDAVFGAGISDSKDQGLKPAQRDFPHLANLAIESED